VFLAVVGLAMSAVACGVPVASDGSVTGYVEMFSPQAGQYRATDDAEITASHGGRHVATTYLTAGEFRFRLPPGRYTVALTAVYGYEGGKAGYYPPGCHATEQVEVRSGKVTKAKLVCHPAGITALGAA
jgi:hypothetical protein